MAVDTSNIKIDDSLIMKQEQVPTLEHSVFVFKVGNDGYLIKGSQGWYTLGDLVDVLATEANKAKTAALGARDTALSYRNLAERFAKGTENGTPISSGDGFKDNAKYYKDLVIQLINNTDIPSINSKIEAILSAIETLKEAIAQRRLPAGVLLPFAGLQSRQPQYTLFCDGSEVSRTTYADLFNTIGTTFGAGDGSTTFNLPDLITTADELDSGNFIRYGDWSKLGNKLIDAIRNITASFRSECWGSSSSPTTAVGNPTGAFKGEDNRKTLYGTFANQAKDFYGYYKLDFDASNIVPTSTDNHPYSIYMVPLITY